MSSFYKNLNIQDVDTSDYIDDINESTITKSDDFDPLDDEVERPRFDNLLEKTSPWKGISNNFTDAYNRPKKRDSFKLLQKWLGIVIKVSSTTFEARLSDLTNPENPEEIGEFDIHNEVHPDDRYLLKEGSSFYWTIGRSNNSFTTIENVKFRRLPGWTRKEIDQINKQSRDLHEKIRSKQQETRS
jgi:hypothetical protein